MSVTLWVDSAAEETVELGPTFPCYRAFADVARAAGGHARYAHDYPALSGVLTQCELQEDADPGWLADVRADAARALAALGGELGDDARDVLTSLAGAATPHAEDAPVPAVTQQADWSCGSASLLAAAKSLGVAPPGGEADVRRLLGTGPADGTPPDALVAGARALGLDAEAREGWTLPQLERALILGRPVVACLQMHGSPAAMDGLDAGHWVVFTGRQRGVIECMDPATGQTVEIAKADLPGVWRDRDAAGRVYRRFGVALSLPEDADGLDAFAEGGGFTGEKKDSLGRRRCYRGGKPVPCPDAGGKAAPTPAGVDADAPQPAAKEKVGGVAVEYAAGTTPAFRALVRAAVESLPPAVHKMFEAGGGTVTTGKTLREAAPWLPDGAPRGWSAGATWDNASGVADPNGLKAAAASHRKGPSGRAEKSDRPDAVVRHEVGHCVDYELGGAGKGPASGTPAFAAAYDNDATALPAHRRRLLGYYLQPGTAGREEAFAEMFAVLCGGGTSPPGSAFGLRPEDMPAVAAFLKAKLGLP